MVLVYAAPKLNSSLVTNVLFVQLEDVEGVLMRVELDPPLCILGNILSYYLGEVSSRCPSSLNSDAYRTAKRVEVRNIFIFS